MFVTLLNILFPTEIEADFRTKLKELSPSYSQQNHPPTVVISPDQVIDEQLVMDTLIQINLLEIRALVLQLLLRPVLQAYAKPEDLQKVTTMSDKFISDESNHIGYSAYCIEEYIKQGNRDWVREMMIRRQASVNEFCLEKIDLEQVKG